MIWNTAIFLNQIKEEFEEGSIDDILEMYNSIQNDYWNEDTLHYFLIWYYILTVGASDPERLAVQNRSCPYCLQKTKLFTKQLVKAIQDERKQANAKG